MIRKLIFSGIFLLLMFGTKGQTTKMAIDAISQANVQQLLPHLDEQLELCILSEPNFVSKQSAVTQLNKFLQNVKPQTVESFHQGSSKSKDSKYAVANLITQKGTFRIFVYSEDISGKQIIREIRIDKE